MSLEMRNGDDVVTRATPAGDGRASARGIAMFYVLAFGISWTGYVPMLARARGVAGFASPLWLGWLILPATGPALAAWIASALEGDAGNGRSCLRDGFAKRVSWRWLAGAILAPAGMLAAANVMGRWLPGLAGFASAPAAASGVALATSLSMLTNPWEEVGWRGFALRRLETRVNASVAALIVGALWAAWHLPLFFSARMPDAMAGTPFWTWSVGCVGTSFAMAWLYNRTGGSLLAVTIFHMAKNVFGSWMGVRSWMALSAVEVAAAIAVVALSGSRLGLHRGCERLNI